MHAARVSFNSTNSTMLRPTIHRDALRRRHLQNMRSCAFDRRQHVHTK